MESVEGVQAFYSNVVDSISGFVALDDHTFQIRLSQPNSSILRVLAVNCFKIIPREEFISVQSFSKKPIGTGPFIFERWKPYEIIILKKNDNYFNLKVYLDSVKFIIADSGRESEAFGMFINQRIDILDVSSRLDNNELAFDKFRLIRRFKLGIAFIGFNLNMPTLRLHTSRQAIANAIDCNAIVNQNRESYTVANGLFPVGMPGYQPQQRCCPFNPKKSKELLTDLNLFKKNKLQCWMVTPDTCKHYLETSKIIKHNLNVVGIDIEITSVNYTQLVTAIKNGNAPLFSFAHVAEIPLPEQLLVNLFHSTGGNNFFKYQNLSG